MITCSWDKRPHCRHDVKGCPLFDRSLEGKRLGHRAKIIGKGMSDQVGCSCGWKSHGYWDGAEWAWEEYDKHLAVHRRRS